MMQMEFCNTDGHLTMKYFKELLHIKLAGASARIVLASTLLHAIVFGIGGYGLVARFSSPDKYLLWATIGFIASSFCLIALILIADTESFAKYVKSISDSVWNSWSFLAILILLLHAPIGSLKIDDLLNSIGIAGGLAAVFIVIPAAAGKFAVSAVEVINLIRGHLMRRPEAVAPKPRSFDDLSPDEILKLGEWVVEQARKRGAVLQTV